MGEMKIISVIIMSFILMVHAQVEAHPHLLRVNKNNVGGDSTKMLSTLCGAATYKDTCMKSLQVAAHSRGTTPQMLVESGVKIALDEMDKASKFTDNLLLKTKDQNAIKSCKHLLEQAKERLQGAMTQVCNANNFNDQAQLFDLRIKLGDVNTFATTCVDEAPPQLKQSLKDGTTYATQLSVNMLDVVTIFNQALSHKLLLPSSIVTINRRLLALS